MNGHKSDLVSICVALIVLDAMLAPLLRTLISEPSDAAYFAFKILAISLAVFNAFIIAMIVRQLRQLRQLKKENSK